MKNLFLFALMAPVLLFGQVTEDFSDGDLTSNPAWTGDLSHFKISTSSAIPQEQRPALQLDAPAAGISSLCVHQTLSNDLEWQCWIKHSFNSSAGNFSRIYLFSDTADLKAPLHGYFLQIGGGEDSVVFFRQDSLETTRLLRLNTAFTGNSTNALRIKAFRNEAGDWKFYCDSIGGHSLSFQGEINDLMIQSGSYFGISCLYTSSNATKFYFDDIYAGAHIIDSIPPALLQADVVTPSEILLTFSEPVDRVLTEDTSSYEIIPGIGHPYEAVRLLDPAQVHLFFDQDLENGLEYTLNISPVEDLSGNASDLVSVPVSYYQVKPYDLVITEIMADPAPPRDLPEFEYLELYNRCERSLNLEGLKLKIGSALHVLPSYELSADHYVIFCDDDAFDIMQHVAPAIGISSFALSNGGTSVHLMDTSGMTIFYLSYELSWYHDDLKADGGWSLEITDIQNPCILEENWKASVASEGGTPGKINSVAGPLENRLKIVKACCVSNRELLVEFNGSLDSISAADPAKYFTGPFQEWPFEARPVSPLFNAVILTFPQDFIAGQSYELTVTMGLRNCTGEEITEELVCPFGLSSPVEPFDIVINEVLFNPLGDGVDYIEIYNRTEKTIDLQELILASVKENAPEPPDTQLVDISASCRVIFPMEYLVLTSDPEMVKSQYMTEDPDAFAGMSSFPSYNNDLGCVLLMNKDLQTIDGMNYSEEMHFMMLLSYEGVSLERISPERPGNDPGNWHSAAETAGFGTPGFKNSQYLEMSENNQELSVQPEIFSPDGDGKEDNLGIAYRFDTPGKLITVLIFNADGLLVRRLANNEMPGTQGVFSWDGTLDDRTEAQNGIYIVYMESLGMDGKTSRHKKAAVLARNR